MRKLLRWLHARIPAHNRGKRARLRAQHAIFDRYQEQMVAAFTENANCRLIPGGGIDARIFPPHPDEAPACEICGEPVENDMHDGICRYCTDSDVGMQRAVMQARVAQQEREDYGVPFDAVESGADAPEDEG